MSLSGLGACFCLIKLIYFVPPPNYPPPEVFYHYFVNLFITSIHNSRLSMPCHGMSWPKQGSLITLLQCCINSTGFWYSNESPSSWRWSPTNAFTVWCHLIWLMCVPPYLHFVHHQQVVAAVSRQQDTCRAMYNDYNQSARLCFSVARYHWFCATVSTAEKYRGTR